MAKPPQTTKQVRLLHDVVIGHNSDGPILGKSGEIATFSNFEANELITSDLAVPYTKGGK